MESFRDAGCGEGGDSLMIYVGLHFLFIYFGFRRVLAGHWASGLVRLGLGCSMGISNPNHPTISLKHGSFGCLL
jgi:hypothetical protein